MADNNNKNNSIMNEQPPKSPSKKERLGFVLEAATALTALGDEESNSPPTSPTPSTQRKDDEKDGNTDSTNKRFLPEHKKPDAALTFPEKLMNLMRFADKEAGDDKDNYCVAWLPDGKSFVIRNPDEFTRQVLPKYFKATKFSSFTRKLYRWGFRQVNRGIGPDDPIIFGNEHFQRDNAEEMSKMRSITAASSRKADAQTMYGGPTTSKRGLDGSEGPVNKRALLDAFLQQKAAANYMNQNGMYGGMAATGGAVSLTSALRPSLGLGMSQGHFNGGLPAMMSKHMDIMGQQHQHQHQNSLIGNYMPAPQQQHPMQQNMSTNHHSGGNGCGPAPNMPNMGMNSMNNNQVGPSPQQYPDPNSTADIVNAAISALRYAS